MGTGVIRDGRDEHALSAGMGRMWTEVSRWMNAVSKTKFSEHYLLNPLKGYYKNV